MKVNFLMESQMEKAHSTTPTKISMKVSGRMEL